MNLTELPAECIAWLRGLSRLTTANRVYLAPLTTVYRYVCKGEPPIKEQVTPEYLRTAVEECRSAADAVGTVRERIGLFPTLHRLHQDAVSLAERLLARPPFPSFREWEAADGKGTPHDHAYLSGQAGDIEGRLRDPVIDREMEEALIVRKAEPPTPQYVTLSQAAARAQTSKRTLERWVKQGKLPSPDVKCPTGKAHLWQWGNLRPALQRETNRPLQERFPTFHQEK